jgi:SAM-dependent methyltransferase
MGEDFDRAAWERRWEQVLREQPDMVAARPPNADLVALVEDLAGDHPPGLALDAGCGHGAEAIWMAAAGWRVTALDFSSAALGHGRTTAAALGDDVAGRITWVEGDLGTWTPGPASYDLVSCLYVHVAGSVTDLVRRLGSGVAAGGTLFMLGHQPVDPATGKPTPAAGQLQVTAADALAALDGPDWDVVVADERPRAIAGTGVDAVVRAVRLA